MYMYIYIYMKWWSKKDFLRMEQVVYVYEVVEQKGFLEGGASVLILDKFSIFILNLSVIFLLLKVKLL